MLEYRALQEKRDYEVRNVEDYDMVEGYAWTAAEVQYRAEQGLWDYEPIHAEDIEHEELYARVDAELEYRAEQEQREYEARNVDDLEDGEEYEDEDEDEDEDEGEMQHYCRNCNSTFGISCLEAHQSVCSTLPTELAQSLSRCRPVLERSRNIGNPIPMDLNLGDLDIDVEFEDEALLRRKRQKCSHEYETIPMDRSDDDDDTVSSVSDEEKQYEDIEPVAMDISDDDTVSCASDPEDQVEEVEEDADYDLAPRRLFDDEMDEDVQDNWNLEEYVLPTGGVLIFNAPSAQEIQWQNEHIEYDDSVFGHDIVAAINENELIERERYEYNLYTLEVIWEHGQLVVTEQDAAEVARLRREIAEYEARIIT
jgi:hypothetical protein